MRAAHLIAIVALVTALLAADTHARTWTTVNGQTFEADFVRVDGENAIFRVKSGREDPYPLNRLSVPDRLFIGRTVHAQGASAGPVDRSASAPSPSPSAAPRDSSTPLRSGRNDALQFAGQPLTAGESSVVDIEVTDAAQLKTLKDAYGKPSSRAKMLIALPSGFQPGARNYPLLIVSSTTDGDASSIGSARANYLSDATEKGYVVIAVDGETGKPGDAARDSTDFRWALVQAGLAALYKEWPHSKKWPIATAGISGGAGYASHQAMLLLDKQFPVIGLLLSVTGWTPGDFPDVTRRAPRAAVRTLPVFLTAGEKDTIATPQITNEAHGELTASGFKNVRFEKFDGGHQLHRPHLQQALDWFVAEYKKTAGGASVL